eukprot:3940808-Rhodomonas_salina.10
MSVLPYRAALSAYARAMRCRRRGGGSGRSMRAAGRGYGGIVRCAKTAAWAVLVSRTQREDMLVPFPIVLRMRVLWYANVLRMRLLWYPIVLRICVLWCPIVYEVRYAAMAYTHRTAIRYAATPSAALRQTIAEIQKEIGSKEKDNKDGRVHQKVENGVRCVLWMGISGTTSHGPVPGRSDPSSNLRRPGTRSHYSSRDPIALAASLSPVST